MPTSKINASNTDPATAYHADAVQFARWTWRD
jgi:hypothetical protein